MGGTAAQVTDWLMVQAPGTWAPKILHSECLSEPLKDKLSSWEAGAPYRRVQFIRRVGAQTDVPTVMMAHSSLEGQWLTTLPITDLEDLRTVDLDALAAPTAPSSGELIDTPLYLVCVHGRRDRCCAVHGAALYRAMTDAGATVWQTSHLGGHRFAAVAMSFPHGYCYGRLRAEHGPAFIEAGAQGRCFEPHYLRGRSCLSPPAQAAEVFLRQRNELSDLGGLGFVGESRLDDERWRVEFEHADTRYETLVQTQTLTTRGPKSCGGDDEPYRALVCDLQTSR